MFLLLLQMLLLVATICHFHTSMGVLNCLWLIYIFFSAHVFNFMRKRVASLPFCVVHSSPWGIFTALKCFLACGETTQQMWVWLQCADGKVGFLIWAFSQSSENKVCPTQPVWFCEHLNVVIGLFVLIKCLRKIFFSRILKFYEAC